MKRLIVSAMLALTGCQSSTGEQASQTTTPEQTTTQEHTTMLTGDYQAVSTCFYRELRGYRKSDDPSMNTSTIVGSGVSGSPEKIEFIGTGEGITKVQAQLGAGAEIAWRGHMSILKQCAETLAAGTTASG